LGSLDETLTPDALLMPPKFIGGIFIPPKFMEKFELSPYLDMERQLQQRRAAINDAAMFGDLDKKQYVIESAAVDIERCRFLIENPRWLKKSQRLEHIVDILAGMADRNLFMMLPEGEDKAQEFLIIEILKCLKVMAQKVKKEAEHE